MADDPQKTQPPGTRPEGAAGQPNGHGAARYPAPANGHDGQDGHKYAPTEDKPKGDDGAKGGDDKGGGQTPDKKPASPIRRLIIGALVAAALVVALIWGWSFYKYSQSHVSTDDAQVEGNLVNISPIIGGTLSQLLVDQGDTVTRGKVIARLEDSGQIASLRQAQAAYQAARSQLPQAQQNLLYQQQATGANIRKAQAELAAQRAKTSGAEQQVALSRSTLAGQVQQAESQVAQAQAQAAQAQAQVQAAQAVVNSQRQGVETAQRAADAAGAVISGNLANAIKTSNDQIRYRRLVAQEAVTPQQYDAAAAAAGSSQSQLDAARFQAAQAHSQVIQARRNVSQAQAQLNAARKAAAAAGQQVEVARAGLGIARANQSQVGIQQTNVANNFGQNASALADLSTAQAGQTEVGLRRQQILTTRAQILQAQAALQNAQVTENDTYISAPNDGTVIKKASNTGASLSPGQTILTITQGDYVYVTANFKETQLRDVRPGQDAEVEVDSFPGRIFHGRVRSINEATGATDALLPPDNATGNFTKVVQRIPVRIELVAAHSNEDKKYATAVDIRNLRQGMSVVATIDVSTGDHK